MSIKIFCSIENIQKTSGKVCCENLCKVKKHIKWDGEWQMYGNDVIYERGSLYNSFNKWYTFTELFITKLSYTEICTQKAHPSQTEIDIFLEISW